MSKTLYIIDSYGLIYKSYYAFLTKPLMNEKGENVSAIFGFFRTIHSIIKNFSPEYMICALDSKTPTFRHEMYPEYKATRAKTPEDLHAQIPVIEQILSALNIPVVRCDGYEADDIIATLASQCKKDGNECRIFTGDKDLMQLVDDRTFIMKSDKTGGYQAVDEKGVFEEWKVKPSQMLDLLSLLGDTADNIPGVKGVGEKTAQKLIAEYGSLDSIFENVLNITGAVGKKLLAGKDDAYFSQKLVRLCNEVPVEKDIEKYFIKDFKYQDAADLLFANGVPSAARLFAKAPSENVAQSISSDGENLSLPVLKQNKGNYNAILSIADLKAFVEKAVCAKTVAFDCETKSVNAVNTDIVGFSLSIEKGEAVYVPLSKGDSLFDNEFVNQKLAFDVLENIFSNETMTVIGHNIKFDYEVLCTNGLKKPKCSFIDTMVASWLLNPERALVSLEELAENKLCLKTIPFSSIVGKNETFSDVPLKDAVPYACEDADIALQLWQYFEPLLKEQNLLNLFYDIEMKLLPILADMEIEGIHIEKKEFESYSKELENQIADLQKSIFKEVGHEFNISSTKQLQEVLFVERNLPCSKKTKTGYSTDTAVLEELSLIDPVARMILEYRGLTKLKSTYADAIPLLADKNDRVHTSFIQTGTATGRLSSRDPNLQNIPVKEESGRKIRKMFTATKGKVLISADYSQIELVILAHLSKEKNLQKSFIEGEDVHKATAAQIFGVEAEKVTAEMRRCAKTINFGVMYGMSAFGLSQELGISRTDAKTFIQSYFEKYSGIQSFIDTLVSDASKNEYVETVFGRKRFVKAINSRNKMEKNAAERVVVNTPIQGSAADIVKKAMINVNNALEKAHSMQKLTDTKLLLQVHDELILECAESEKEEAALLLQSEMENVIRLDVPLRVSVETGKRWGDFH